MIEYDRLRTPRNWPALAARAPAVADRRAFRPAANRKSTLFQHEPALAGGRTYRTLDDFATLAAAQTNPETLLEDNAIIDEVQRCPDLFIALKRAVDARRQPGRLFFPARPPARLKSSLCIEPFFDSISAGNTGQSTRSDFYDTAIMGNLDAVSW